jgi:hypothetical protein
MVPRTPDISPNCTVGQTHCVLWRWAHQVRSLVSRGSGTRLYRELQISETAETVRCFCAGFGLAGDLQLTAIADVPGCSLSERLTAFLNWKARGRAGHYEKLHLLPSAGDSLPQRCSGPLWYIGLTSEKGILCGAMGTTGTGRGGPKCTRKEKGRSSFGFRHFDAHGRPKHPACP